MLPTPKQFDVLVFVGPERNRTQPCRLGQLLQPVTWVPGLMEREQQRLIGADRFERRDHVWRHVLRRAGHGAVRRFLQLP